jgi:hypothetical protein
MRLVLLFILFPFLDSYGQDDSIIKMFQGKWRMDIDNSESYEEWIIVNVTELKAAGYLIINGDKVLNENIFIKKFENYWMYITLTENQTPTMFVLKDYSDSKFVFENKEHDFPQKVTYEFHNKNKLTVTIEGEIDGEFKKEEFHFNLIQN